MRKSNNADIIVLTSKIYITTNGNTKKIIKMLGVMGIEIWEY